MKLKAYLELNRIPQKEFAAAVGCKEPHASLLVSDKTAPSLKLATRIFEWSEGAVGLSDWSEALAND